MRAAAVLGAAVAVSCVVGVSAAPATDALIRPGRSIAGAGLGMTEVQLRRAKGAPFAVVRRSEGFGRHVVEYQYADGYLLVQLRLRRGALRVVRMNTIQRNERTREGVGVGVKFRRVLQAYPRSRCRHEVYGDDQGRTYVRATRCTLLSGGARTVFEGSAVTVLPDGAYRRATPANWPDVHRIVEIKIEYVS